MNMQKLFTGPKKKICCKLTRVNEFVSSWEQIWRNSALIQDPLQWMGAVRMKVQTADKNIRIIHTTPVHQLTSCEAKSCVFVRIKFIMTYSNGTHSHQRIRWWASDEMLHFSKSDEETVIYFLDGLRVVHFKHIFIFGWPIPSNMVKC